MKYLVLIIYLTFNLTSFCQTENFSGNYEYKFESNKGEILEYKLSLNSDGTFLFHSYRNILTNPEENSYGKGKWKAEKTIIFFYTDSEFDLTEKYILNFNNSKARFISKSPRDKSDRIIKTNLRFYESEMFWVSGMKLFKVE